MGIRVGPVGPRGLALLACAGVAGAVLGVHGWSARHVGLVAAATGGFTAPARTSPAASTQRAAAGPAATSPAATAATPSGGAPSAQASASASGGAGPLLSSEPYASYAYQIWPGPAGTAAKQAMTGLTVSVSRQGSGLSVTAGVNGQPAPTAQAYPNGARVYVVEATLGDDSGGSDYSLGDDGLVVTNAQGRIVQ